jgi:hypothetical protein
MTAVAPDTQAEGQQLRQALHLFELGFHMLVGLAELADAVRTATDSLGSPMEHVVGGPLRNRQGFDRLGQGLAQLPDLPGGVEPGDRQQQIKGHDEGNHGRSFRGFELRQLRYDYHSQNP